MGNQAGSLKKHIETAEKTGKNFMTLTDKARHNIFMVSTKTPLFLI